MQYKLCRLRAQKSIMRPFSHVCTFILSALYCSSNRPRSICQARNLQRVSDHPPLCEGFLPLPPPPSLPPLAMLHTSLPTFIASASHFAHASQFIPIAPLSRRSPEACDEHGHEEHARRHDDAHDQGLGGRGLASVAAVLAGPRVGSALGVGRLRGVVAVCGGG